MEIGVFEAVPATGSIGIEELAAECEADASLISELPLSLIENPKTWLTSRLVVRLMRQLTCVGMFKEVKLSGWAHTPQTFVMSNHAGMTGKYFFEVWYVISSIPS